MRRVYSKGDDNILSYGFNKVTGRNNGSIHAEHDAINKLKPLGRNKKEIINLLVVRFSKNKKLQNSKPCANCIKNMKNLPQKKGYKIKNIYYSNDNGVIVKITLSNLENQQLHYSKYFRHKYKNSH